MKNTLNLAGDGDDADVVRDVEKTFDIAIANVEAEACHKVGDLFDLVVCKHATHQRRTQACLTQVAFYRLRRALVDMGYIARIAPDTPISSLLENPVSGSSTGATWYELQLRSGLSLPSLELSWQWLPRWLLSAFEHCERLFESCPRWGGWIPLAALVVLATAAIVKLTGIAPGVVLSMVVLYGFFVAMAVAGLPNLGFGIVPERIRTIGDLACESAGSSFAGLHAAKRGCSRHDLWFALMALLRRNSGHKGAIDRDTTFFANQSWKSR